MTCDCRSYNRGVGATPEVPLDPPAWSDRVRPIMVDACIAPVVQHLWAAGIVTLGSCCGHSGQVGEAPSIVLGEDRYDPAAVRATIAEVDDREFALLQWRLCDLAAIEVSA